MLALLAYEILDEMTNIGFQLYKEMFKQQTLPNVQEWRVGADVTVYKDIFESEALVLRDLVSTIEKRVQTHKNVETLDSSFKIDYPYGYEHKLDMPTKRLGVSLALDEFLELHPHRQLKFISALDMVNITNIGMEDDFLKRLLATEEERIVIVIDISSRLAENVILALKLFIKLLNGNAWLKIIVLGCERTEFEWARADDFPLEKLTALNAEPRCSVLYASVSSELNLEYEQFSPLRMQTMGQPHYGFDAKVVGFIFAAEIDVYKTPYQFPVTLYIIHSEEKNPPISALTGFRNFQFLFDRRSSAKTGENYVLSHCDGLPETSQVSRDLLYKINLIEGAGSLYAGKDYIDVFETNRGVFITAPVFALLENYGIAFIGSITMLTEIEPASDIRFADKRRFMLDYELDSKMLADTLSTTETREALYTVQEDRNCVTEIQLQMVRGNFVVYRFYNSRNAYTLPFGFDDCPIVYGARVHIFGRNYCSAIVDGVFALSLACDFISESYRYCETARLVQDLLIGTSDIMHLLEFQVLFSGGELTEELIVQFNLSDTDPLLFNDPENIIISIEFADSTANFVLNRPVVGIDSGIQIYRYGLISLFSLENKAFEIKQEYEPGDGLNHFLVMNLELQLHPEFEHLEPQYRSIRNLILGGGGNFVRGRLPLTDSCHGEVYITRLYNEYYIQLNGFYCQKQVAEVAPPMAETENGSYPDLMNALLVSKRYDGFFLNNSVNLLTGEPDFTKMGLIKEYWRDARAEFDEVGQHVVGCISVVLILLLLFIALSVVLCCVK